MFSGANYQGLQELSPDGVIVVRADGRILAVNENLVALFGYSAQDLQGLPLEFLLPGASTTLQQLLQAGPDEPLPASVQHEFWVQNASGNTLAVDTVLTRTRTPQDEPALVCISVRNATQRKKTELMLEEARLRYERSENDLRALSNTLPLVIFQWEGEDSGISRYSFMGTRLQELLGISAEQVMADPGALLGPLEPGDRQQLLAHIAQAQAVVQQGCAQASFSLTLRAQVQGQPRWLRLAAMYGGRKVDERTIWNGYLEDITQRTRAETERELATLQFRTLWEKSPDSYLFLGPEGVLSCNAAALDLFGVQRAEDLLGHGLAEARFSPPQQAQGQDSPTLFAALLAYASAQARAPSGEQAMPGAPLAKGLRVVRGALKFEWLLLRQGSVPFVAEIVVTPMQIDARHGYLLICQDVSLQRQAEQELLRAKLAAEDMARTKADFLANMSHEIRTPMNAIVGLSHLVLQGELNRAQRDFLTRIQESGRHLLGIVNDILDFSKMEAGMLSVDAHDFTLASVLEKVGSLVLDKARAKGLELLFDVAAGVPAVLHGDSLRLGQILINYASNAVKFTEQGKVCIAVMPLWNQGRRLCLRFEVRDTGIGLSQEQIGRLFQSFHQADGSTTRKYGGTGLGLAICKSLAALMHGEVGCIRPRARARCSGSRPSWRLRQHRRMRPSPPSPPVPLRTWLRSCLAWPAHPRTAHWRQWTRRWCCRRPWTASTRPRACNLCWAARAFTARCCNASCRGKAMSWNACAQRCKPGTRRWLRVWPIRCAG